MNKMPSVHIYDPVMREIKEKEKRKEKAKRRKMQMEKYEAA